MAQQYVNSLRLILFILMAWDIMSWVGVIPRFYQGGFYCNDPTIQHLRQLQSIRGSTVILSCAIGGYLTLLLGEWFRSSQRPWRQILRSTHRWYRDFVLGYVMIMFVSELIKNLVVAPRPDFMDTCQPNVTCASMEYVTAFECLSPRSAQEKNDALKSFPSGHAGSAVYTALYLMTYLHRSAGVFWPRVAWVIVELAWVTWAVVTCASRVSDHRHHVRDVIGGILLAFLATYWTVVCVSDGFCEHLGDSSEEEDPDGSTRLSQKIFLRSDSERNGSLRSRDLGREMTTSLTSP